MNNWLVCSILALVTWGFWGLFPKLAVTYTNPTTALFYEAVGSMICGFGLALYFGGIPEASFKGAFFGIMTGMVALLGAWFYLNASRNANISLVVVITALYPVVTVLLAVIFLKEPFGLKQSIALVLSLIAIALLATDQQAEPNKSISSIQSE
jgi:transporter family protein